MPKLTYEQIRELQERYGQSALPTDQFAQMMNRASGTNDYDAGVGQGLGALLHRVDYNLNRGLKETGLPQALGDFGEATFGDAGRMAFEGIPRMTLDMLPLLAGGLPGMLGLGVTFGTSTYGHTDSPAAGVLGGAMGLAMGPVGRYAGNKFAGLVSKNTDTLGGVFAKSPLAAMGLADAAPQAVNKIMGSPQFVAPMTRAMQQVGEQGANFGMNVGTQALTGAVAAPKGETWNAFKQAFEPVNLAAAGLAQAPFMAIQVPKQLRRDPETRQAYALRDTYEKYSRDVMLPRDQRAQLVNAVEQRLQTLALPAPRRDYNNPTDERVGLGRGPRLGSPIQPEPSYAGPDKWLARHEALHKHRAKLEQRFSEALANENESLSTRYAEELQRHDEITKQFRERWPVPEELGGPLVERKLTPEGLSRVITPEFRDVVMTPSKPVVPADPTQPELPVQPEPLVSDDPVKVYQGKTSEEQQAVLDHEDPNVSTVAALIETVTEPEVLVQEVKDVVADDVAPVDAQAERQAALLLKAQKSKAARDRAEKARQERDKAVTHLKRLGEAADDSAWWDAWSKANRKTNRELVSVVESQLGKLTNDVDPSLSSTLFNRARQAIESGETDPAKLRELLDFNPAQKQKDVKSRTVIGKFKTEQEAIEAKLEAEDGAAALAVERGEGKMYQFSVETNKKTGKIELVRYEQLQRVASQLDIENLSDDVRPEAVIEQMLAQTRDKPQVSPKTRAQQNALRVIYDPLQYVDALTVNEWSKTSLLPRADDPRSFAEKKVATAEARTKLVKTLSAIKADHEEIAKTKKPRTDETMAQMLVKRKAFADKESAQDFINEAIELIGPYVANITGQKFLSLTPSGAALRAGGGFWYNLGAFDGKSKIGKHQIPNSGLVAEEVFTRVGRGTDRPLVKGEVELYRVLVPEAFSDGKVDVKKLYELLPQREPVLEIKTLGEDGANQKTRATELRRAWANAQHIMETKGYAVHQGEGLFNAAPKKAGQVYVLQGDVVYQYDINSGELVNQIPQNEVDVDVRIYLKAKSEYFSLGLEEPGTDTRYSSVAPRAERDMPGYVEVLVRARNRISTGELNEVGKPIHRHHILYRGPHFGAEDTNVLGFFRGYTETLPSGEKAFHVIEVQSDWGQGMRRKKASANNEPMYRGRQDVEDHPLLSAYENLALKAAVKHAREQGATRLILSDAETAMMSEGHDTAVGDNWVVSFDNGTQKTFSSKAAAEDYATENNGRVVALQLRPSQEGGMRLHYDTTLPSELQKITGDKGRPVDLGVHEKAKGTNHDYNEQLGRMADSLDMLGSPVFKDAAGNPKTNITGTMFDISQVPIGETAPKGQAMGSRPTPSDGTLEGERMTVERLLNEVGLGDEVHVQEATRLLTLFNNSDVAFARLAAQPGQAEVGLFTQQYPGQKLVWLAAQKDPRRTLFVLAHELNGHGLQALHRAGKLDAESSRVMTQYNEHLEALSPEQRKLTVRELWKTLPESYRKDTGLREMLEARLDDVDEVTANINAMVSLSMVNAKPSALEGFIKYMPKPIADFIVMAAKWGRKMLETLSGTLFARRVKTGDALEPANEKALNDYVDKIYQILKIDNARAQDLENATRLQMTRDPAYYAEALDEGTMFLQPNLPRESQMVVQAFRLKDSKDRKAAGPYERNLQPLLRIAKTHPEFQRAAAAGIEQEIRTQSILTDIMRILSMEWDSVAWKSDKNSSVMHVELDPVLSLRRDNLQRRANVLDKTVTENILNKDPDTLAELKGLTPEQQRLVRESFAKTEQANTTMTEFVQDLQYKKLVFAAAKTMMLEDTTLPSTRAESIAQGIVQGVRDGTWVDDGSTVSKFINASHAKIVKDYEFFKARPQWVSESRFGDFEISWTYRDPSKPRGYFRAKTEGEMNSTLRGLEARRAAGEIADVKTKVLKREQFDAAKSTLDVWAQKEAAHHESVIAQLKASGIDEASARAIVEASSAVADMQRELAMKQLPTRRVKRRFADGREMLDMLQQQLDSTNLIVHGLSKSVANAEHSMLMQDPEVLAHPYRDLFLKAWRQYRNPDTAATKAIQKASYYSFLSFNFLNMAQDAVQPIFGALAPDMIADGAGIAESYKRVIAAMVRRGNAKKQSPDERAALERFRKGNRGLATYTDEGHFNNDLMSSVDTRRLVDGKDLLTKQHWLASKIGPLLLWNKRFHKKFTDFGVESAFLAAYEHMKVVKKMTPAEAETAARLFTATSMGSWGKSGRAVGIWAGDDLRPVSASLTTLQTFAFNQVGALKNYFDTGILNQGLTKPQRTAARKAFATHLAMMYAHAGLLGLPFVSAVMLLIDKAFGINSREAIASELADDEAPEDGSEYATQHIALHGLLNMMGGDLASRSSTPGIMGINSRDGFSADALLGPTYSMLTKMFEGATKGVQERNIGEPLQTLLPNQLQKAVQFWRDDYEYKRKDGSLIAKATASEKLWSLLGVKPTRVANVQERDSWQYVDAQIEQNERTKWINDAAEMLQQNDVQGVQQAIQDRVRERPTEQPQAIAELIGRRIVEQQYGKDPRHSPGYSERLGLATGAPGIGLGEAQRLQLVAGVMQSLGYGVTRQRARRAYELDAARVDRPWMTREEITSQLLQAGRL